MLLVGDDPASELLRWRHCSDICTRRRVEYHIFMSAGGQYTLPAPPPAAQSQQPLKIGRAFIKQYYNCLLNSPAELCKFYAPDSAISRGMEPTAPTEPLSLKGVLDDPLDGDKDLSPGERMRRVFFDWADADDQHVRIDFASGAIDAQESREGFLIVVTGHMYLPKRLKEKAFVHTFILNNEAPLGQKKVFLLKNDILRFLDPVSAEVEEVEQEEIVEGVLEEVIGSDELAQMPTPTQSQAQPVIVQDEEIFVTNVVEDGEDVEPTIEPVEFEPSADEEKIPDSSDDDEDGVDRLEVGNSILCDTDKIKNEKSVTVESSTPSSDGKKKRRKKRGSKSRSRSSSPEDTEPPEKPKAPGSWASLVASTGRMSEGKIIDEKGNKGRLSSREKSTSKVSTPTPQAVDESKANGSTTSATPPTSSGSLVAKTGAPNTPTSTSNRGFYNKRTPEATLFIRNIPDKTTEDQIKAMFEPHGQATGNKILGMNLIANRGFAFVDFDGTAAVDAIVKEAKESIVRNDQGHKIKGTFMVGNRVLVIEPKVAGGKNNTVNGGVGGNINKERRPYYRHRGDDG